MTQRLHWFRWLGVFVLVLGLPALASAPGYLVCAYVEEDGVLQEHVLVTSDVSTLRHMLRGKFPVTIVALGTPDNDPIVMIEPPDPDPNNPEPIVQGTPDNDPIVMGTPDNDPIVMFDPDAEPIAPAPPGSQP